MKNLVHDDVVAAIERAGVPRKYRRAAADAVLEAVDAAVRSHTRFADAELDLALKMSRSYASAMAAIESLCSRDRSTLSPQWRDHTIKTIARLARESHDEVGGAA